MELKPALMCGFK